MPCANLAYAKLLFEDARQKSLDGLGRVLVMKFFWQVLRAVAAGSLQTVTKSDNPNPNESICEAAFPSDRWEALVRYDTEIAEAAKQLRPFGEQWVRELGRAYFILGEDRRYLPNIIAKLLKEAQIEQKRRHEGEAERKMAGHTAVANVPPSVIAAAHLRITMMPSCPEAGRGASSFRWCI
jgi:hypothetical protein